MPTALKGHGNRGIVVPVRERIPGISVRNYSTIAGSSSTVSTDSLGKLRKINELCIENPDFIVQDRLYRLLYDKEMYYAAYYKLRSKPGNMIPGMIPTTLDGVSATHKVIMDIIESIRDVSFQFQPISPRPWSKGGRRIQIPATQADGGQGPLTIAPLRDKLVQECIRTILEAIYEPSFSHNSHGFRPKKSCHTAIRSCKQKYVMAK